jgi:hypothetical protein
MPRHTVEREMYFEDFYRLFVADGDGRRIIIIEGRTEGEARGKLRKMPLAAQVWIRSCGPIIHERRWYTPAVEQTREVGRIPVE